MSYEYSDAQDWARAQAREQDARAGIYGTVIDMLRRGRPFRAGHIAATHKFTAHELAHCARRAFRPDLPSSPIVWG